ncbi:MAG: DUF721 domain-containing protein [Terriglobia bacterium]
MPRSGLVTTSGRVLNFFSAFLFHRLARLAMEELGSILPKAFQKHVLCGRKPVLEILVPLWPRAVGKFIGQCSRPVAFEDGRLTLAVSSPSWETQLRALSDPLQAQINSFLGAPVIKKLRIRPHTARDQAAGSSAPVGQMGGPRDAATPARGPEHNFALVNLLRAQGEVALPPELVDVVERSFVKYFSRNGERNKA